MPLKDLHPDPANVRRHGERNLEAIAASIKQWGQVEPLIVQKSTGRVIGGNARLHILKQKGETEADVVEVDVDDVNAAALGIALNRTAELAEWDEQELALMLDGLEPHIDLEAAGFLRKETEDLVRRMTAPSNEDWADYFEKQGNTAGVDDLKQITFVLASEDHERLVQAIKRYDANNNVAIVKLVDECCS